MNYFDLYSTYPDRTIVAAWESQVKEADNTPWPACTLTECGANCLPAVSLPNLTCAVRSYTLGRNSLPNKVDADNQSYRKRSGHLADPPAAQAWN
jgi:hypothetical protein